MSFIHMTAFIDMLNDIDNIKNVNAAREYFCDDCKTVHKFGNYSTPKKIINSKIIYLN